MKINKFIYAFMSMASLMLVACNDDDVTIVNPTTQGTVTDDMGNTYGWVRIGNLDWTTSNALNGPSCTEASFEGNWGLEYVFDPYYDEETIEYMLNEYIPEYGNFMNYEDAKASAPDGWRLPTDEDWKALERALGMQDADNMGWRGEGVAPRLMEKDSGSQMGALLAGGIIRRQTFGWLTLQFQYSKERAYFWTSTDVNDPEKDQVAYFRKLVFGVGGVERQLTSTENLMSVRWCRNATND